MAIDSCKRRRNFGGHALPRLAVCVAAIVVAALSSSAAQASIVCPEPAAFELDDAVPAASAGSCSRSSAPATTPSEHRREQEQDGQFSLAAIPSSGGSTSGTSSSGGGTSGANVPALDSSVAVVLYDAELVRWFAGERRLALPTPPGSDLLRPPQAA